MQDITHNLPHIILETIAALNEYNTVAWGISGAIHHLEIATKKVLFINDANFYCVVSEGE